MQNSLKFQDFMMFGYGTHKKRYPSFTNSQLKILQECFDATKLSPRYNLKNHCSQAFKHYKRKYYMEFDVEIAKKIQQEFGLSEQTIVTWKNRKKIPNMYFSGKQKSISKKEDYERIPYDNLDVLKMIGILKLEQINAKEFVSITQMSGDRMHSFLRLKTKITKYEMELLETKRLSIIANIQSVLRDDRRFTDKYLTKIYDFLAKPEIVMKTTLRLAMDLKEFNRFKPYYLDRTRQDTDQKNIDRATKALQILLTKIQ